MAEYIDLNEAIIDFGFEWDDIAPTRDEFINFLKSRKRANVKEIIYAHWIMHEDYFGLTCECSNCHIETMGDSEYCPHCGAEMSEVNNGCLYQT